MIIDKLIKKGNITQFENKILERTGRGHLLFGNKIQLAEIKILTLINEIKYNEEYFQKCDYCQDKFSISDLTQADNNLLCQNCIDENYFFCGCGELVYNEDVQYFEDEGYCQACYFKARQQAYKEHDIIHPLLIKLSELKDEWLKEKTEFKIENNTWTVESFRRFYRLGSWGANSWIDIGNCEADLLKAIDYNLGKNREKLTKILINDVEI